MDGNCKIKLAIFLRNEIKPNVSEIEYLEVLTSVIRICDEFRFNKNCAYVNKNCLLPSILIEKTIAGNKVLFTLDKNDEITLQMGMISLTVPASEYNYISKYIYLYLNSKYGLGKLDFRHFSSIYLEHMLGVDLPFLSDAIHEEYTLMDLRAFSANKTEGIKATDERYYQCLCGKSSLDNICLPSNHFGESNESRLFRVLKEVKKHGYPYEEQLIVVYNNEMIIRDGEHRWACLYYLYGNIKIPVLRLIFFHNFYSFSRFHMNNFKGGYGCAVR
jgi:hypothetical protein